MKFRACVFVTANRPRAAVQAMRKLPGVAEADALFGSPDAITIAEGDDASMDPVVDAIAAQPEVGSPDSKVRRWID